MERWLVRFTSTHLRRGARLVLHLLGAALLVLTSLPLSVLIPPGSFLAPTPVAATMSAEDFNAGVNANRYEVTTNAGLYTVDTDGPTLRITKSTSSATTEWNSAGASGRFTFDGDFTVTVDFTLHDFPTIPSGDNGLNESILGVATAGSGTGAADFLVLRYSTNGGQFMEGYTSAAGPISNTPSALSSGQYRIQRTGTTMSALYSTGSGQQFVLLGSHTHASFAGAASVRLQAAQGSNVAGGITANTPLDIGFDNLTIEAASFSGLESVPPPAGLVGWWPGDGNANDIQGTNDGTLQGGATFAPGKVGQAFMLDGIDDSVDLGGWFNLQTFTIEMWVKAGASQVQNADILDNNHTAFRSWVVQYGNVGTQYHWCATQSSSTYCGVVLNLTPATWQHLAITVDASHVNQVYLDGALVGSVTDNGPIVYDGSQFLRIGRWGGGGRNWNGQIDELAIYNRSLTASEIEAISNAGSAGKIKPAAIASPAGMVSWWPGDGNANDIQGTNHGTLQGGATFAAGKVGQAFSLDGIDDYVFVPHSADLDSNIPALSVDFWLNPDVLADMGLVTKHR